MSKMKRVSFSAVVIEIESPHGDDILIEITERHANFFDCMRENKSIPSSKESPLEKLKSIWKANLVYFGEKHDATIRARAKYELEKARMGFDIFDFKPKKHKIVLRHRFKIKF